MTIFDHLRARLRVGGSRRGHDIAIDVAASRKRGQQGFVDSADQRAQIRFHDPMKLNALAGCDAQRVVSVLAGKIIEDAPLPGRHDAAGNAAADHHDVFLSGFPEIAIVLLIRTVKFEKLNVVLGKMICRCVRQRRRNGTGQRRARFLDALDLGQFGWLFL